MTITYHYNERESLNVKFSVHGHYRAATRDEPAEWPELEILSEIPDGLTRYDMEDIEVLCWKKYYELFN